MEAPIRGQNLRHQTGRLEVITCRMNKECILYKKRTRPTDVDQMHAAIACIALRSCRQHETNGSIVAPNSKCSRWELGGTDRRSPLLPSSPSSSSSSSPSSSSLSSVEARPQPTVRRWHPVGIQCQPALLQGRSEIANPPSDDAPRCHLAKTARPGRGNHQDAGINPAHMLQRGGVGSVRRSVGLCVINLIQGVKRVLDSRECVCAA